MGQRSQGQLRLRRGRSRRQRPCVEDDAQAGQACWLQARGQGHGPCDRVVEVGRHRQVGSIAEAKQLAEGYQKIRSINLGNTKESPTTRTLTKQVFVEPDEEQMLRDMAADGIELEYRALADDPKVDVAKLLDE